MILLESALWHGGKQTNLDILITMFFKEMTISRARFKLALRFIKRHENQIRQDAIADALCEDSEGKFWK